MSYATEVLAITGKSLIITLAIGGSVVAGVGIIVPEWQAMVEGPSSNPDKGAACKRAKQLYLAVTGAEDSKAVRCVGSSVQDAKTGPEACQRKGSTDKGYKVKQAYNNNCAQHLNGCLNWNNANVKDDGCEAGTYLAEDTYSQLTDEQKAKYIEGH